MSKMNVFLKKVHRKNINCTVTLQADRTVDIQQNVENFFVKQHILDSLLYRFIHWKSIIYHRFLAAFTISKNSAL